MFKNLFKSKKEVATNSKVEKLNINELKNVIGGGSSDAIPTPDPVSIDPVDGARIKSHSNQTNN